MTTTMVRQVAFTTGEVDTITWKRTDVEVYMSAAQSLLNVEVGTTGLAKKRKGTQFMLDVSTIAKTQTRMFDFIDKSDTHYIILAINLNFYVYQVVNDLANVITTAGDAVKDYAGNQVVAYQNGLVHFAGPIPFPYKLEDLSQLDYTQDNDSIIFTHPNYKQGRIYIKSYGPVVFAYQYLDIYPPPAYDFNKIAYNQYHVSLAVAGDQLTFQFTGLGSDPGFNSAWIGGQIIGGGASDIDPVGSAIITSVSYGGGTTTFIATIQVPFQTSGYATQGAQYSIRQPAWSAALGYPSKVVYYQNRLWFGGTASLPATVFGSKINAPINFDVGTGRDTDAIVYSIGQNNTGPIRWMNAGKQLEVFTENFEFACPQDLNTAITPSTFSIRQQSSYGSSPYLKPLTYINDSYYATKTGKSLSNYHFNGVGQSYTSSNISVASSHLVKNPFSRALLRGDDTSQDNYIYFLNNDSTITAFQFASEYKLAALTPIKFQENVSVIDIVTSANEVYVLKSYNLTGHKTIEKMTPLVKVDNYQFSSMDANGVIAGLQNFIGYTLQVIYKGQDYGQYLVNSSGTITLPKSLRIADTVTIGLLYDLTITPMYLFAGQNASPLKKQITSIYVDYESSLNFKINGKLVPYQQFADIQAGLPLIPRTGTAIVRPFTGWNDFETLSITQSSPFDLQITSIAYQISSAVI